MDYALQQADFISRRQEGTCQWLLDSPEFQEWLDTDRTLFCPGIPGAGKTILTSVVVENLITRFHDDKSIGIAYIYCDFQRQRYQQKPEDLLASLLKQLATDQSSIPDSVKSLYNQHKDKRTRPSLDDILKNLCSIMTTYSRVYILVDALDECNSSDRSRFLANIFDLQAKTGAKFFATSRPIPDIVKEFSGSLSREILASNEDVQRYLDDHMSQLPTFVLSGPLLQEEIKSAIVRAVDGMFLLAQLYLRSLGDRMTVKAIKNAIQHFQKQSDGSSHFHKLELLSLAYEEAMVRINGQDAGFRELALKVLSWITCARRPLTTVELQDALAVECGDSELDNDNIPQVEDIVAVCARLVTVDRETDVLRLVHYTAKQYFERTQEKWFSDTETNIATTCVTYLSFDEFGTGICHSDKEFEERLQLKQFYGYASRNWGHHARKASTLVQEVTSFLKKKPQVQAASQGLLVVKLYSSHSEYSQEFPRQMTGLHLAAHFGVVKAAEVLLGNSNPDPRDSYNRTPLLWAAQNGHQGVVELLLDQEGVNPDSKDMCGHTPLSWAASSGQEDIVKLLLTKDAVSPDSKDTAYGQTPLSRAAGNGYEAVVKLLLAQNGVDPNSKDADGRTPLSWAAANGHEPIVKLLLTEDGIDPDSRDIQHGQTPLSRAAQNGQTAVVELLLRNAGVNSAAEDTFGRTPLAYAAKNGQDTVVMTLLSTEPFNLDPKDFYGSTPLSIAVRHGYITAIKLLLDTKRVDINVEDCFGRTSLWWARKSRNMDVTQLILDFADIKGISLRESEKSTVDGLAHSDETSKWCDVCTLSILKDDLHYGCEVCNRGDFDMCSECYKIGGRCLEGDHRLIQRGNSDESGSGLGFPEE